MAQDEHDRIASIPEPERGFSEKQQENSPVSPTESTVVHSPLTVRTSNALAIQPPRHNSNADGTVDRNGNPSLLAGSQLDGASVGGVQLGLGIRTLPGM